MNSTTSVSYTHLDVYKRQQHLGILAADVVELVILLRDVDLLLELADARPRCV